MTALLRPPDWTLFAACRDEPPALWDGNGTPTARAICAGCPVRLTCALDALAEAIPDTMRGGLTPDERAAIADTYGYDRPGAARHGDRSRYVAGCRCPLCREAHRRYIHARSGGRGHRPHADTTAQRMSA